MPDLIDIIRGAGAFFEGASNGYIITQWAEMSQSDALNSIEEFVKHASTERIDSMDATLLQLAHSQIVGERRLRLIRLYAFFKVVEFHRFQQWRGFPPTVFD